MKMTGEERITAPIGAVWHALNDPDVLRVCIPGCQSLEPVGDDGFQAAATIKIGPISARFGGMVKLFDLDPPNGYRISGEGSGGAAGAAKGGANVRLVADGAHTVLHYEVSADVSGRLAQLGGKLIDMTAKQLASTFFSRFSQEVERRNMEAPVILTERQAMAEAGRTAAAPAPLAQPVAAPVPERAGISVAIYLLSIMAALVAGFVIGRGASGWDGAGALAASAMGLLVILVAAAAFLFGQRPGKATATVSLDTDTIARLAAALRKDQQ